MNNLIINQITHFSTLQAEVRKLLNSCDLDGFNEEFFLNSTLVGDIADFVQKKEQLAYNRGAAIAHSGGNTKRV